MRGWDITFKYKKNLIRNSLFLIFAALATMGFRTFPNSAHWTVSSSSPKLWIKFCDRSAVTNNDLPQGDPLYGQTLSFTSLVQSIMDDFNTIPTSYLRLYDADTDPAYTTSLGANHTIYICYGTAPLGHGGYTVREEQNGLLLNAHIVLSNETKSSAKTFVRRVTHELGHAVGLDHPQDTNFAIMSYFGTSTRLEPDDKMGVTFIYPSDASYGKETATFGMSCGAK